MRTPAPTQQPPEKERRQADEFPAPQAETNRPDCPPRAADDSGIAPHKGRLTSLDAFRGFTIALMILVNSPGDPAAVYPLLSHASWNGWTFADSVFPSFLFIVGVSLVFSFAKREETGIANSGLVVRILETNCHTVRARAFC